MNKKEKKIKEAEVLKEMEIYFPINSIIECQVIQLATWGILTSTKHHLIFGFIRVIDITDEDPSKFHEKYPKVYDKILAKVIGYTPDNNQILLSIKPSVLSRKHISTDEKFSI